MPKMRNPIMAEAARFAVELRRVRVAHSPVHSAKDVSAFRIHQGRIPPTNPGQCEYCHRPVPKKGLKFCGRHCYLRHSVEIRQPIRLAQERLAQMRASGLDPGHGGDAALIQGSKLALSNARRAFHLTPEEYRARRAGQQRDYRRKKKGQSRSQQP